MSDFEGRECQAFLIAGASVRAVVQSAQRAGCSNLIAADLFQDRDLGNARRYRMDPGYANLDDVVRLSAATDWMYTGALENHPDQVDAITARLLGNGGDVLRLVRNPWRLHDA